MPVICLGNLTVGGAGKTPAAIEVGRLLLAAHERPYLFDPRLWRAVGWAGARRSGSAQWLADVGDEPLLLARLAPTIVSRDRVAGAEAARRDGATVIVMDDGFQNPSLTKDLAILWLTVVAASATAGCPGRSLAGAARGCRWRVRTPSSSSARRPDAAAVFEARNVTA